MPEPNPKPAAEGLQFDRAEVAPALKCSACRAEINDVYYKLAGNVICEGCKEKTQKPASGSAPARFIKATVMGIIAAAIGTGIYYGVLAASGYHVGLISILVGIIVGVAVNIGSDRRGGFEFQLLAVVLTYTAIAGVYLIMLLNSPVGSILSLGDLVVSAFVLPFERGMKGILGLVIIGFGLYQAFIINKKKELNIRGPFQRKPAAGSATVG